MNDSNLNQVLQHASRGLAAALLCSWLPVALAEIPAREQEEMRPSYNADPRTSASSEAREAPAASTDPRTSRAAAALGSSNPADQVGRSQRSTPAGDEEARLDPVLVSASQAVRQIWAANPQLAELNLRVRPVGDRLVFEGQVPNAELWERAKDTAEGVITRIPIENRIRIERR